MNETHPTYISDAEKACEEMGIYDVFDAVEYYHATPDFPLLDLLAPPVTWEFRVFDSEAN